MTRPSTSHRVARPQACRLACPAERRFDGSIPPHCAVVPCCGAAAAAARCFRAAQTSGAHAAKRDDTASATLHCLCVGIAAALAAAVALISFDSAGESWTAFTFLCFALG